jgi:ferredoxin
MLPTQKKTVSVKYNNLRSTILKDLNDNTWECAPKCRIACACSTPAKCQGRKVKNVIDFDQASGG